MMKPHGIIVPAEMKKGTTDLNNQDRTTIKADITDLKAITEITEAVITTTVKVVITEIIVKVVIMAVVTIVTVATTEIIAKVVTIMADTITTVNANITNIIDSADITDLKAEASTEITALTTITEDLTITE